MEFSYQLPPDLKLTINPRGYTAGDDDDDDDEVFQRADDTYPPVVSKDIDDAEIKISATDGNSRVAAHQNRRSFGQHEPEPEHIKSSDSESGSARKDKGPG